MCFRCGVPDELDEFINDDTMTAVEIMQLQTPLSERIWTVIQCELATEAQMRAWWVRVQMERIADAGVQFKLLEEMLDDSKPEAAICH